MKILQLVTRVPYPLGDGGAIGIFNITKNLALLGHEVKMVALVNPTSENLEGLTRYCKLEVAPVNTRTSVLGVLVNTWRKTPYTMAKYHSQTAADRILDIVRSEKFDLVHVDHLHMAYYGQLVKQQTDLPVVLRQHNLETTILERFYRIQKNPLIRCYAYLEFKKLCTYEPDLCKNFDLCMMITREDEHGLKRMSPTARTVTIPAGVDTSYFHPTGLPEEPLSIISVASMDWRPNVDAVLWFCDKVLPIIRHEYPSVKFHIVGKGVPRAILARASDNVIVAGFVPDVRELLSRSAVVVVPLRVGGGMRIKILNALAMGKAIVSTSVGCEGIDVIHRQNIFIADTAESFARGVVDLLRDEKLRRQLGEQGLSLVKARYEWQYLVGKMEAEYLQLVSSRRKVESSLISG